MEKRSIIQKIKSWIAAIGWYLFIWGNETTPERYWNEIYEQEKGYMERSSPEYSENNDFFFD